MTAQAATPRQTGVLGRLEPRGGARTEGKLRGAGRRADGRQPEPVPGTTRLLSPLDAPASVFSAKREDNGNL